VQLKSLLCFATLLAILASSGCLSGSEQGSKQGVANESSPGLNTHAAATDTNIELMASKGNVQGIIDAVNDTNSGIKLDAIRALGKLLEGKGQKEDPALNPWASDKSADPLRGSSINVLKQNLNDPDQRVVIESIRSLGKIGDRRSVDPMIDELRNSDPQIRAIAAEALGDIGVKTKSALPLKKVLKDPEPGVRSSAESALKAMGIDPYPAPNTGTYLIGEPNTASTYEGWVCEVKNLRPQNAVYELTKGGAPYVAVFVRSGDSYVIKAIDPESELYITTGDNWDNEQLKFTKNVYRRMADLSVQTPRNS